MAELVFSQAESRPMTYTIFLHRQGTRVDEFCLSQCLRVSVVHFSEGARMIVMKLSRVAGVSEAGARRRNPERAQRVEGSHNHRQEKTAVVTQVLP
jgi:hypothetical protein